MSEKKGKIVNFLSEAQKEGDRRSRMTAEKRCILKQSITGDTNIGNTQIGGDLIVNTKGPSFVLPPQLDIYELKAIQDLTHAIAALEMLAKKNAISSPKGIGSHPPATTAACGTEAVR